MAFQFTRWNNPDAATCAFKLPDMPFGVSHGLRGAIDAYCEALRNICDTEDQIAELCARVLRFEANGLPDTVAKILIQLHRDNSGLDGDTLLLIAPGGDPKAFAASEAILDDLYRLMPQDWASARAHYEAALTAENEYDRRVWKPAWETEEAGGQKVPKLINEEMERLQDIRCNAENVLLDIPAPDWPAFAFKYLICFDNDRDLNGYHEDLCAEAKRLLAEVQS